MEPFQLGYLSFTTVWEKNYAFCFATFLGLCWVPTIEIDIAPRLLHIFQRDIDDIFICDKLQVIDLDEF